MDVCEYVSTKIESHGKLGNYICFIYSHIHTRGMACCFICSNNNSFCCKKCSLVNVCQAHYHIHYDLGLNSCFPFDVLIKPGVGRCLIASRVNRTFFEVGLLRDQRIYRWVYVLATPDEARNYLSCFTMEHSTDEKEFKMTWSGKVHSLFEAHDNIVSKKLAFNFGYVTAQEFVSTWFSRLAEVKYSVKIRNLKEEAKDDNEESGVSEPEDSEDEDTREYWGPSPKIAKTQIST